MALLLLVPARARRWAAGTLGCCSPVVAIWKILDLGFLSVLQRPFDPALDWTLFDDAESFLSDSVGQAGAILAVVVVVLLAVGLPVLLARAVLRLSGPLTSRRSTSARAVAALSVIWVACAVLGAQLVPGIPVADRNVSALAHDRAMMVRAGILDQDAFAAEASVDAFRDTPADQLLTGLRGKDVIVAFVESYGRTALESPEIAPQLGPVLEAENRTLSAAGFSASSGYLTSSTVGSGSGLAHATLLSGLWIDSNRRWRNLTSSDRLTLSGAFQQAGWRTVGIMPGNTRAWPEGDFYRFDKVWDSRDLGYQRSDLQLGDDARPVRAGRLRAPDEHGKPDRAPLFAQINLVSSHAPWVPIPQQVDWNDVGDGSIFAPMAAEGAAAQDVWSDPARLRHEYGRSIGYSMDSLVSYRAALRQRRHRARRARRPPAAADRHRRQRQPRRADLHHRPRPVGAGPDGRVGLAGRPEARSGRAGLADGHLPRPVPDRLRAERRPGGAGALTRSGARPARAHTPAYATRGCVRGCRLGRAAAAGTPRR